MGTTHKGEGEEFKMLEYYYNKSKAYEDANKKKTKSENELKIFWFSRHAELLREGKVKSYDDEDEKMEEEN